ncbi:MAG: sugar kinase [Candidatus Limivicinus sp.]|nr:sugar kinase [Candidatus Limivicinus sp.]
MDRKTEQKIVLVTQKTRLEELICRYNTEGQVRFYLEHHGGDFDDYKQEHDTYRSSVNRAISFLETYGRLQIVDRDHIPNYLFGDRDLVIVVGRDGLVANVLKYLSCQQVIGINPDPGRWDGVLLPFAAEDLVKIVPETCAGRRRVRTITMAQATLNDGQTLYGVNDLFIGQKTHVSARYELRFDRRKEAQSSSGIIVSTGLGSTGWLKSILAGAAGISRYCGIRSSPSVPRDFTWESEALYFTVREPYPSISTGADMVFGKIGPENCLEIVSAMPQNGVIFSDGVEQDYLQFNSGTIARIGLAEKQGHLVV